MGLKGAPSFFQMMIATMVLAGLLYTICELYIDDIITTGQTEEEFMSNLRKIFKRCRQYNIKLNPKKCRLGLGEVEYVGHQINSEGLTFTKKKRDSVIDFPRPEYGKQLKSFLGLANFFRDHIRNHSTVVKPLQDMISDYEATKRAKLKWTEETTAAFEEIKQLIDQCPTLYFMHEDAPVYLHTDASDYGIGAYLFQVVDGKERPVQFLSKSLSKTQQRWSTIEKECYSIHYAIKRFEYLLRDIHFVLRTDHDNLTHINTAGSAKVIRWKLDIQEYDFDIEHIPGHLNVASDHLSRLVVNSSHITESLAVLCPIDALDHEITEYLCPVIEEIIIPRDKYKIISKVHNSVMGHYGVEKTVQKLQALGHDWQHMREHVRVFNKRCPICQKLNVHRVNINTQPFTTSMYGPQQRINIDTMGPFTADEAGNKYVISIVDTFSRWVELYPVQNVDAVHAAEVLLRHIGRVGCPHQLLHDNGPEFVNELIAELSDMLGLQTITTIAYSKEENSIVERQNKEYLRHIRAIVAESSRMSNWSRYLPIAQRIMNASINESTGVSPSQLMYGNAIDLDRNLFHFRLPSTVTQSSYSEWANDMLATQKRLLAFAEANLIYKDQKHMAQPTEQPTVFPVGTYVLLAPPPSNMKKGPENKLGTPLAGPYRVEAHQGAAYSLRNLVTNRLMPDVHIKRLQPFLYDPLETSPEKVALGDISNKGDQLYVVEAVLDHKGDFSKKKTLEFLVKWEGYDEDDNSWLTWRNLINNACLHAYMKANNLQKHIPKQFR